MKKLLLIFILLSTAAFGQQVIGQIGVGTTTPSSCSFQAGELFVNVGNSTPGLKVCVSGGTFSAVSGTATAIALSPTPTLCSAGQAPTGIDLNGNATGCAAIGGTPALNAVTNPSADTTFDMTTHTLTFNITGNAGASNVYNFVSNGSNATTGRLFTISTGASTTQKPFGFYAQGTTNGIEMASTGAVSAVGSGVINATNIATTASTTNADFFPIFVASSSNGNQAATLATGWKFNPSTGQSTFPGPVNIGPGLASDSSTTNNKLAKLSGGNIVAATTSDTNVPVWIVTSGGGTASVFLATSSGQYSCVFDGATTAGHYVVASATSAADCSDGGATVPTGQWVIGQVLTTNGGAGTYTVQLTQGQTLNAAGTGGNTYSTIITPNVLTNVAVGPLDISVRNGNGTITASSARKTAIYRATTASSGAAIGFDASGSTLDFTSDLNLTATGRWLIDDITNVYQFFGFSDQALTVMAGGATPTGNYFGIAYGPGYSAPTHYFCITRNGTTMTATDTGVVHAANAAVDTLKVAGTGSTSVTCTINGTTTTVSTNMPAAGTPVTIVVGGAPSTASAHNIDLGPVEVGWN